MALKDQPYFPFYVKDFNDDDQLKECDAEAHGVYIRIMCLMHKSKSYGRILLEQKYQQEYQQTKQQKESMCTDFVGAFAIKLKRHLPFSLLEIERGLCQLIENDVIKVDGNTIYQKRMVKDGKISEVRASAGRKSASGKGGRNNFVGTKLSTKLSTKELANNQQNTAIANENENKVSKGNEGVVGGEEEEEGSEGDINIDYYIGNWHLTTGLEDCLCYFKTNEEFTGDRKLCYELFKKQYVTFTDEEIYKHIDHWAELFNQAITGRYSERNMRGDDSWPQHFINWLKGKNLNIDPTKPDKVDIKTKKETFQKTLSPHLEKYGKKMLNDFYRYWAELNEEKTLLRWEMEKTWEISSRLRSWYEKSIEFSK